MNPPCSRRFHTSTRPVPSPSVGGRAIADQCVDKSLSTVAAPNPASALDAAGDNIEWSQQASEAAGRVDPGTAEFAQQYDARQYRYLTVLEDCDDRTEQLRRARRLPLRGAVKAAALPPDRAIQERPPNPKPPGDVAALEVVAEGIKPGEAGNLPPQ
jgi:hypothetical protein